MPFTLAADGQVAISASLDNSHRNALDFTEAVLTATITKQGSAVPVRTFTAKGQRNVDFSETFTLAAGLYNLSGLDYTMVELRRC